MLFDWIDNYCLSKNMAVKDYKIEWEATRYLVGGKMFAMIGNDKEKRTIISLKLNPEYGQFLRSEYEDIYPGYYLNKIHWNSIDLEGDINSELFEKMIDQSYQLVFNSLSKKIQNEINCSYNEI